MGGAAVASDVNKTEQKIQRIECFLNSISKWSKKRLEKTTEGKTFRLSLTKNVASKLDAAHPSEWCVPPENLGRREGNTPVEQFAFVNKISIELSNGVFVQFVYFISSKAHCSTYGQNVQPKFSQRTI